MCEFKPTKVDVSAILRHYKENSTKDYDLLVNQLNEPVVSNELLLGVLKGLHKCVTELDQEFEIFVGVLLKVDWASRDQNVVDEYYYVVSNLVSSHPCYLGAILKMCVRYFNPKITTVELKSDHVTESATRIQDDVIFSRIHTLLQAVVKIIPMTPFRLLPLLSDCHPFVTKDVYCHECYVRNLLEITRYLPEVRLKILRLVIQQMAALDVRAPREAIQAVDADASDNSDDDELFDMDDTLPPRLKVDSLPPMSHPEAHKLDTLMFLMFSYIKMVSYPNGEDLDWKKTRSLYLDLLKVFDEILLPTHASCHAQFIIFYICSFHEMLLEGFIDYLWKKVQNPNIQGIFRQSSVAYLASLLARARYIPVSTVEACLDVLVEWVHRYITHVADSTSKPDIQHHGPFYSVCQALFYVFVFRHAELVRSPAGLKRCQALNLQTIVTCRLNPLKMCLPVIANTFASITRIHQVAFCDAILEKNRRCMLPEAGSSNSQSTRLNPLDSFFPFDPYILQRSSMYIQSMYQEYEGALIQQDDDKCDLDLEEESQYMDCDQGHAHLGSSHERVSALLLGSPHERASALLYGASPGHSLDKPSNLLMFGVSPGFKHHT